MSLHIPTVSLCHRPVGNTGVSSHNTNSRASRPHRLLSGVFTLCLDLRQLLIRTLEINSHGSRSARARYFTVAVETKARVLYKLVSDWPTNLQGPKILRVFFFFFFKYLGAVVIVIFGVGFDVSFFSMIIIFLA